MRKPIDRTSGKAEYKRLRHCENISAAPEAINLAVRDMLTFMGYHQQHMRHCLFLAENGRGKTGINPMVGSVLVRSGNIITEAWHESYGSAHAERALLRSCDDIRDGDVLYVNLEPCSHQGKTPPCTDIIIESGIKHVVYGMKDPNPSVSGKGLDRLRQAGICVTGPVLSESCRRFNRGFVSVMERGRPWITLKAAVTRDGRTAEEGGSALKITSNEQDRWSHECLRSCHDAILVGVGTVVADDPLLDARLSPRGTRHDPRVIVLDPSARLPRDSRLIRERSNALIWVVSSDAILDQDIPPDITALKMPTSEGYFDVSMLLKLLATPTGQYAGIASILVEGGSKTWNAFRQARCIDEEIILTNRRDRPTESAF